MDFEHQALEWIADQRTSEVQLRSGSLPGTEPKSELALGYRRFRDFDPSNAPGQDFAALRVQQDHVVGLVVDGVSQSFFGDLAACQTGNELLSYLWEHRKEPPTQEALVLQLDGLMSRVREIVRNYPISAPEGSILRSALEETREDGTEAVFAAFILDLRTGNLTLYHLGDVHVWLLDSSGQWVEQPFNARGRWSSARRKHQTLTLADESGILGVLLHSDGMANSWVNELGAPRIPEASFKAEAELWAARDDVSFVSVSLPPQARAEVNPPAREVQDTGPEPPPIVPPIPEPEIPGRRPPRLRRRVSFSVRTFSLLSLGILLVGFGAGFALFKTLHLPRGSHGPSHRFCPWPGSSSTNRL